MVITLVVHLIILMVTVTDSLAAPAFLQQGYPIRVWDF